MLMVTWPAGAVTVSELQMQLQALQSQLNQMQISAPVSSVCAGVSFSRNLNVGASGADVKCLQQLLNRDSETRVAVAGMGSAGFETMLFGPATKSAVIKFQEKFRTEILVPSGLSRGTGMVGLATRIKLNALLASITAPIPAPALPPVPQKTQSEMEIAAIAKASPAVVSIVITKEVPEYEVIYEDAFPYSPWPGFKVEIPVYKPTGKTTSKKVGAGSGFLITQDGYILTNKHVVDDDEADYVVMLSNGAEQRATIYYKDSTRDVAIVKIGGTNYPTLELGDSAPLSLGQPIITIGNALGQLSNSVSLGTISGMDRTIRANGSNGFVETLEGVIQSTAAISPGNSGGPLLDLAGRVVGMNVAMVQGYNNISFSIPINQIKTIVKAVLGI